MSKKPGNYKKLDPETIKEITNCVIKNLREEEPKIIRERHNRMRANIKQVLRKYRDLQAHADKAVYKAIHAEDDFSLRDLLDIMSGNGREMFRVESIRKSAVKARLMIDHMDRMIESYHDLCKSSGKPEEERRYRVLQHVYISPDKLTPEEVSECENVDKSTIYRDIDIAAERLSVLFFGVYGLDFL
jgi:hypothetical protein